MKILLRGIVAKATLKVKSILNLRAEEEEKVNNEQTRQIETNKKMVDLNISIPIITLNVNGLNTVNKLQKSSAGAVDLLCTKTVTLMHQC